VAHDKRRLSDYDSRCNAVRDDVRHEAVSGRFEPGLFDISRRRGCFDGHHGEI
jgi:hypothetical protein